MPDDRLNLFLKSTFALAEEDRVTNALLILFQHCSRDILLHFLKHLGVHVDSKAHISIREHIHYDAHNIVDGELSVPDKFLIPIESKIYKDQFIADGQAGTYFRLLSERRESRRVLLLISPDDREPDIVSAIKGQTDSCYIKWISWNDIHKWLREYFELLDSGRQVDRYLLSEFLAYLSALGLATSSEDDSDETQRLRSYLKHILGNETAEKALLHIYHFNGSHARKIARDHSIDFKGVLKQLRRFERSGVLRKEKQGNTVVYSFNERSPFFRPVYELIRTVYDRISLDEKQRIFSPGFRRQRE